MAIKVELIDELLKGCKTQEDVFGENGVFKQLVKSISERALQAELTTHLGYEKHDIKGKNSGNSRNGTSSKTIKGEFGEAEIGIPRDRTGTFEPRFIPKGETRFEVFMLRFYRCMHVVYQPATFRHNCKNCMVLKFLRPSFPT